ncbi:MAG: hypothetical protein WD449_00945 [Candidatus Babeliales bacterium]
MKKFLCLFLLVLCNAQAGNGPYLASIHPASRLGWIIKSPLIPCIMVGVAFCLMPSNVLVRETIKNLTVDTGSSYASKMLPWPFSLLVKEWNRARQMEALKMKLSYALAGAAVAMFLMQQTDRAQQPMVFNNTVNIDAQSLAAKGYLIDEKIRKGEL